ncbi:MAG: merA [Chloroflexi bacterium]|jgi:pyruvate/2-oxoglutarate dehydrogenase complex dihydrolipoamide dehydrogenase (E3) component|nr:merA [Chloroflexota bacterium]
MDEENDRYGEFDAARTAHHQLVAEGRHDYDLIVLGSGSAAFAAAITATESGALVALMEANVVGGTCVNVGCIPSKAMLAPADLFLRAGQIVAEATTGRLVGASVVADGAGDVIQGAVYAIQFGLTMEQLASTWAPYLTVAEALKLAAQTFTRDVSKLSCCAV